MTAITEWGLRDRSGTFSFYVTAFFCTRQTESARFAANLADAITIAGPKGPNAVTLLRDAGVEAPILFDGTGYKPDVSLAADTWVSWQLRVGASCPLLPGVFLPWDKDNRSALEDAVREQSRIAFDLDATMLLAIDVRWVAKQTDLVVDTLQSANRPVALVFAHRADPLAIGGAVAGLRRIASRVEGLTVLRSDHGAIGALAFGADHASIGLTTTTRHFAPVEMRARRRPGSLARVFVRSLLDWFLADTTAGWTAAGTNIICELPCCNGLSLDRFIDSDLDVNWHNMNALADFANYVLNAEVPDRGREFLNECQRAASTYGLAGFNGPENPKAQLTSWALS